MTRPSPFWLVLANHARFCADPRTTDAQRKQAKDALAAFFAAAAMEELRARAELAGDAS